MILFGLPGEARTAWVSKTGGTCRDFIDGARKGTRTPTPLRASGPKPGASTNFAILAARGRRYLCEETASRHRVDGMHCPDGHEKGRLVAPLHASKQASILHEVNLSGNLA